MNTYYKFGPTPDNPVPHCHEFLFDGTTGTEFLVDNTVVLHLVDGLRGNNNLTANGVIVEPGGPALTVQNTLPGSQATGSTGAGGCSIAINSWTIPMATNSLLPLLPIFGIALRSILKRRREEKNLC